MSGPVRVVGFLVVLVAVFAAAMAGACPSAWLSSVST
jgi:hypothetical protein